MCRGRGVGSTVRGGVWDSTALLAPAGSDASGQVLPGGVEPGFPKAMEDQSALGLPEGCRRSFNAPWPR